MASKKKTTRKKAGTSRSTTGSKTTARKTKASKKAGKKRGSSPRRAASDAVRDDVPAHNGSGVIRVERQIGGRTLTLETGRMAKLADGAVVARYGDTMVLASAQSAAARPDIDFFPLTVDYREKTAAAGMIPGGFFKREGRPGTKEILTCRIIDRTIRPLFPDGYKAEVQVLSQVLATDQENDSDIVAAIASFAALAISSIPHGPNLGMARIGMKNGKFQVNPTWSEVQTEDNDLNLIVAAHDEAIVMVEAGANQVDEETMLEALEMGHEVCRDVADLIGEFQEVAGKEKQEFVPPAQDEDLVKAITRKFGKALKAAPVSDGTKKERQAEIKAIKTEIKEAFPVPADAAPDEAKLHEKTISETCYQLTKQGERDSILDGRRADGRDGKEIRPICIEVGALPRVHGSVLFTRGETQALGTVTLGGVDSQQIIDGLFPLPRKRFMLHYTFPPFSVGEVRRMMGPGRREIGHGALAERSLEAVLPVKEDFPYTIRVTSEILESNGSSSMATVCSGTLAMMDAGVPIKDPVAGIAMGLVMEGKDYAILSDILGSEDHCGDMDFKVAGTPKGITALQMDIKCEGLTREILEEALEQAREGRVHILKHMLNTLRRPRQDLSPNAPRLESVQVPSDKIGAIIGPGGRNIRQLQEDYEVKIAIEDSGLCTITGTNAEKVQACMDYIGAMTAEVEVGQTYKGQVVSVKEFGAFIQILPGQEGMCHLSELDTEFVRAVTDVVNIGDEIEVKVIDIDDFGKIKLSRKALLTGGEAAGGEAAGGDAAGGDRPRGRGRREERDDDRPRGRGRRDDRGDDRPRGRGRRDDRDDDRPRRGRPDDRDGEERPRRAPREDRDDDRPRGRGRREDRDGEERPRRAPREDRDDHPRGRGRREDRDSEERPRRAPREDRDDDRPRGRGRREERDDDRPARRPAREDRWFEGEDDSGEERGAGGRPRRARRDDEEDAPRRRAGEARPGRRDERGRRDDLDENRPRRGRRDEQDEDAPRGPSRRGRDDEEEPRGRRRRHRDAGEDSAPPADSGESLIGDLESADDLISDGGRGRGRGRPGGRGRGGRDRR